MTFQYFFFDTYVGDFLQVLPAAVLAAAICGLCRRRKLRRAGERWRWQDTWKTLLVSYLTGLLALVAVPSALWNTIWYSLFYGNTGGGRFQFFTPVYNLVPDFFRDFPWKTWEIFCCFCLLAFCTLWREGRGALAGPWGRRPSSPWQSSCSSRWWAGALTSTTSVSIFSGLPCPLR